MEPAVYVSIFSAIISLATSLLAWRQATIARESKEIAARQKNIALYQAGSAEESAQSARRSVELAANQVEIANSSLRIAKEQAFAAQESVRIANESLMDNRAVFFAGQIKADANDLLSLSRAADGVMQVLTQYLYPDSSYPANTRSRTEELTSALLEFRNRTMAAPGAIDRHSEVRTSLDSFSSQINQLVDALAAPEVAVGSVDALDRARRSLESLWKSYSSLVKSVTQTLGAMLT